MGTADIHPDRNEMEKKVELINSVSGPGSLDPIYELQGVDLPIGEVRWTSKRNLEEFFRLISVGGVNVGLITHRPKIEDAEEV